MNTFSKETLEELELKLNLAIDRVYLKYDSIATTARDDGICIGISEAHGVIRDFFSKLTQKQVEK